MTDLTDTGRALLSVAGLDSVPADEKDALVASYPGLKGIADALYGVGGYDAVPAVVFDPAAGWSGGDL